MILEAAQLSIKTGRELAFEAAMRQARPLIEAKHHHLDVRLPEAPVRLRADPVRLAQVITNLLDNAAKYTPDGGRIELFAGLMKEAVAIRVRDNGIGIPAELRPYVFDLFQQGEQGLDRPQGGLGIGLSLAKRLVAMHDGRIDAACDGAGRRHDSLPGAGGRRRPGRGRQHGGAPEPRGP